MQDPNRSRLALMLAAGLAAAPLAAQKATRTPITDALKELGEDVRIYNDHIVTLANPFMQGRIPGSRGMEVAKEYCEFWLKKAGLQPAFAGEDGRRTWRQPFPISRRTKVVAQSLAVGGETFAPGRDFNALGYGGLGAHALEGPVVFAGYGIEKGPNGDYRGWDDDADFTGKIVVVLRFEPMDSNGKSKWATGSARWSNRIQPRGKLRALSRRGAAAVILANTPGADDPRTHELSPAGFGRRQLAKPVLMMTADAADRLARRLDPKKRSLLELRKLVDGQGRVIEFGGRARIETEIVREPFMAENVAGLLPGRGGLRDEYILVGAHLDHLGMGNFGSRDAKNRGKKLHPGADDNASGSAGVLMIADKLAKDYARLPAGTPARSVILMLFSAEESGLVGSQYYVKNPIVPLKQHALMINFDMIGRVRNRRLAVYNTHSAKGLDAWLQPFFDRCELDIQKPRAAFGGSDHLPFDQRKVPNLFAIIADFHDDYHTSRDESWKINRVDAVHTTRLFHEIARAAATRSEPFVYESRRPGRTKPRRDAQPTEPQAAPSRRSIKVSFGIMPGSYEEDDVGVLVGGVTEDSSAARAGIREGDRLMTWNGENIGDIRSWMTMLMKQQPGDEVKVGIDRGGKRIEKVVKLQGRR